MNIRQNKVLEKNYMFTEFNEVSTDNITLTFGGFVLLFIVWNSFCLKMLLEMLCLSAFNMQSVSKNSSFVYFKFSYETSIYKLPTIVKSYSLSIVLLLLEMWIIGSLISFQLFDFELFKETFICLSLTCGFLFCNH